MDTSEEPIENFKISVLPDSSVIFSYEFQNISQLNEKITSPPCYINNLPWRILIISNSQNTCLSKKVLSIYLQCDPNDVPKNWSCQATADISIMPVLINVEPLTNSISHIFSAKENDWGFTSFVTFENLLNPENGYCANDSITIQIHANVNIPHGVFWDSKKYCGFVGLTNQGATCYMNSLLQTLFFTNELRRAIYCMPTEADDAKKSVAFALQRIFYDLQFSDKQVGTKLLTNSFGWDTMDSFMQHDVQEFLRVLLAKIETKMEGTTLERIVPNLFAGKMCSYIRCKSVSYSSSMDETFYDIQLSIKGKKNIYESFQDYVAPEILDGENKYFAGEYGLQEAEKGVTFKSLPPVLHLHLMRFQYDSLNDNCIKFNDYFEFYETIDLSKYLELKDSSNFKNIKAAEYRLHAILVHSGDNHGGHYVVYINIDAKGKWFKFDDEIVSVVTSKEAIEQNFGVLEEEKFKINKTCSTAYMLSYIQISEIPNILKEINESDINTEFIEHLNEVKRIENIENLFNSKNIIAVNVIDEDSFDIEDIQNFLISNKIRYVTFQIDITKTVGDLIELISNTFLKPKASFRLWSLLKIYDNVKLIYLNNHQNLDRSLQSIKDLRNPWFLLMQYSNPLNLYSIENFDLNTQIFVIYKLFQNNGENKLLFLGISYRKFQDQISEIVDEMKIIFKEHNSLEAGCEFIVYEENSGRILNPADILENNFRFKRNETNCITLIFEKLNNNEASISSSYQKFLKDQNNQFEISFININKSKMPTSTVTLQLSGNVSLEEMALQFSKNINVEMNKIQFFKTVNLIYSPATPLKIDSSTLIQNIFKTRSSPKLFYQILPIDFNQLQNKLKFPIKFLLPNSRGEKELLLYFDKNGFISDVIDAAKIENNITENHTKYYVLVKIQSNIIVQRLRNDAKLSELDQFCENGYQLTVKDCYCIEAIDEINNICKNIDSKTIDNIAETDEFVLVPVMHFNRKLKESFGIPFFVAIKQNQTFEEICEQIRKKLSVSEFEWSNKYKVCLVALNFPWSFTYLSEDMLKDPVPLKYFRENADGSYTFHIGLDHKNKIQKRSKESLEKSLKIYN